jgi:hypothetical protein
MVIVIYQYAYKRHKFVQLSLLHGLLHSLPFRIDQKYLLQPLNHN